MVHLSLLIAFAVVCSFIAFKIYEEMKKRAGSSKQIPGVQPRDSETGNISDIQDAGSLHEFLVKLHNKNGPVASFWLGKTYVVSTADATALKAQMDIFDRPPELFSNFLPLFGPKSVQFANGLHGHNLRHAVDKALTHEQVESYVSMLIEVTEELASKWLQKPSSEHIPLRQNMLSLALRGLMRSGFGEYFADEADLLRFEKNYDIAWHALEEQIKHPDSDLDEDFHRAAEVLKIQCSKIIKERIEGTNLKEGKLLIDNIIDFTESEEERVSVALTYMIGGFHTTGTLMTWLMFYLARHPEWQQKIHDEIVDVFGHDEIYAKAVEELSWTKAVIEESLRLSALAPYAARVSETDIQIGEYTIPKKTPMIQALGVICQDGTLWNNPETFAPERFRPTALKKMDHLIASPFFGFGARKCPGFRFFYMEVYVFLSVLLRKFVINLANPEEKVTRMHGLVTRPEDEIYITLTRRATNEYVAM